ncbi:MAG: RDD family protein [Chloroflexi bacterium]|nr:RDD family protein [Chloroflexota bacterium]
MTQSYDTLQIDTPENVSFGYDVAGIGSRFLAALVDTILMLLLQVIIFGTIFLVIGGSDILSSSAPAWVIGALSFIAFVFFWGYYIFFEILWNGQSPGKRMVGLRVIRVDGTPVTAAEVVIRNLVRLIDFLPSAYGVGVIAMFVNDKSRRLGDLAAGTVVVHDRSVQSLDELAAARPLAPSTLTATVPVPTGFPLERMKGREVEILEEYMSRRARLSNRDALASQILHSLATRLGLTESPIHTGSADDALIAIYAAVKNNKSE